MKEAMAQVSGKYIAHAHTLCAYSAFLIALFVGCYTEYEKIVSNEYFGYPQEWIPSVSATTGDRYPARAFFQVMIALTSGPRLLLVFLWYLKSQNRSLLIVGFLRTVSCGGWVYVTSTDDHGTHDIAMIVYLLCTLPWMLCILAQAQEAKALQWRRYITLLFFGTLLPMVYFFIQHKVHRVPGAYSIYALFEWSLILYDVGFDALSCYEFEKIDLRISPRLSRDMV
ncbi:Frag1/DRAM/Sfk1 [Sporodiniella umbellata]|nr:Frag1/DRAM/Sfk1 [Sporodiniella umbellata]